MTTSTFIKIETISVGSGGASAITFNSIPANYTDLCVKLYARTNRADSGDDIGLKLNTSTSSFEGYRVFGTGSNAYSTTCGNQIGILDGASATSNTFGSLDIYFSNYLGSQNKFYSAEAVSENNATSAYIQFTSGVWNNSSAITSIAFYSQNSANFVENSVATLYGIKKN